VLRLQSECKHNGSTSFVGKWDGSSVDILSTISATMDHGVAKFSDIYFSGGCPEMTLTAFCISGCHQHVTSASFAVVSDSTEELPPASAPIDMAISLARRLAGEGGITTAFQQYVAETDLHGLVSAMNSLLTQNIQVVESVEGTFLCAIPSNRSSLEVLPSDRNGTSEDGGQCVDLRTHGEAQARRALLLHNHSQSFEVRGEFKVRVLESAKGISSESIASKAVQVVEDDLAQPGSVLAVAGFELVNDTGIFTATAATPAPTDESGNLITPPPVTSPPSQAQEAPEEGDTPVPITTSSPSVSTMEPTTPEKAPEDDPLIPGISGAGRCVSSLLPSLISFMVLVVTVSVL
jgi:hypothetical protein